MAIAFVQYDDFEEGGADTTIANDVALNTTNGNFITVVANGYHGTTDNALIDSIADTAGNTYVRAIDEMLGAGIKEATNTWYAENITGNANNVVTVTFKGSCTDRYISVSEYSGVAAADSLDDTANATTAATFQHSSGDATASLDDCLVIGGIITLHTRDITVGPGFTTLTSDLTGVYHAAEYDIIESADDYDAYFETSDNTNAAITCAIFKGVVAAPAGGQVIRVLMSMVLPVLWLKQGKNKRRDFLKNSLLAMSGVK